MGHFDAARVPALLATFAVAISTNSFAADSDLACIKTKVSGDSCQALKVEFDLSACKGGSHEAKTAWIRCKKDGTAIARALVDDHRRVRADLKKESSGLLGANGWSVAGDLKFESAPKGAAAAAAPVHHDAAAPAAVHHEVAAPAAPVDRAAASAPASEAPAAAPAAPASNPLSISGYFDAYYAYNFNGPAQPATLPASTFPNQQNGLHYYDWYHNQLGLSMAEITVKHKRQEVSFLLDLDFGSQADLNSQYVPSGSQAYPDETSKHVGQAILTYEPGWAKGLVFDFGKMATHVGLEVYKAKDNWNYTRSVLFAYGIPLWHEGAHVGYSLTPELTIGAYAYSGWNTIYAPNNSPTAGAQIKWAPAASFNVIYNYIGGPNQRNDESDMKQVHNVNATWAPTSTFSFAFDAIYGSEDNAPLATSVRQLARWAGAEILAKWQATPRYSIAPRVEFYSDPQGYTLGTSSSAGGEASTTLQTYTLTQALQVADGFEARVEVRHDRSSVKQFTGSYGATGEQTTALVGLLYTMP